MRQRAKRWAALSFELPVLSALTFTGVRVSMPGQ